MEEKLNLSEKNGIDSVSSQNVQSLESFLDICNDFYSHLSDLLLIDTSDKERSPVSLKWKLTRLGNKYQQILSLYKKRHSLNEENFGEYFGYIQNFFVELGKILGDIVNDVEKGKNKLIDEFIEKMFKLNEAFYKLSGNIKNQEYGASYVSFDLDDDSGYSVFNNAGGYDVIFKGYKLHRENNKRLGINIYRPLLKLVNKELESLLGGVSEEGKLLSKEDFINKSENLFIMNFLNVRSYKDFCKKYDILKNKQKELFDLEQKVDECFDEEGKLRPDIEIDDLHMKVLERFLKTNFVDVTAQKIAKALDKKKKSE